MAKKTDSKQVKISKIETTKEQLSSRGGLFLILKYLENIGFFTLFQNHFKNIKGSAKGLSIGQFIKQITAFFIDGDDLAMTSFDRRKKDQAYRLLLENTADEMASSHQMKRFFQRLMYVPMIVFRNIMLHLFIWRLQVEKPSIIVLFGDSVVWNNDDANKRQGVEPTYKKHKGFHPLQISWGPYIVDALFRAGSVHSNHGDDFIKAIARLTDAIRRFYKDVPIIVLMDSAFMDNAIFSYFEQKLKIFYICAGKLYDDLKQYVQANSLQSFKTYVNDLNEWQYIEFGNRLKSWQQFRRCIYTTANSDETGQLLFDFARPDTVIYTNIGTDQTMTEQLMAAAGEEYLTAEKIIQLNHQRGKSELTHRSEKEFACREQFPFELFAMNQAYYYLLMISHILYESYKVDVTESIIPSSCYPTTFRRMMIDFAVKIVSKAGQYILKVSEVIFETLKLQEIWNRINSPPYLLFAQ